MHNERGQEILLENSGLTVSSLSRSPPSTPTRPYDDPKSSLTSSPSSPQSQGYPHKPPVHPRRASQTLSIKSTSSSPRDSGTIPATPPSPGMITPITRTVIKGTEASSSHRISTTYKPYLPRTLSKGLATGMHTHTQSFSMASDAAPAVGTALPPSSASRFSPSATTAAHLAQPIPTQPNASSSKLSTIKGFIAEKGGSHRHMRGSPGPGTPGHTSQSPYSTSTSTSRTTISITSSGPGVSSSFNTPQAQSNPQFLQNLTPSSTSYTSRQSWKSWATDKIGAASAKVQAGAAIVASSASAWKDNRDLQRDVFDEDYGYYNHHQQQQSNIPGTSHSTGRPHRRGSKDSIMAYNEGVLSSHAADEKVFGASESRSAASNGGSVSTATSGCATVLAPGGVLETLHVFPGWGVRRYRNEVVEGIEPRPFDIELYISGFAIYSKTPETASRSQRAFLRLAKGFASLPKLPLLPNVLPDIADAAVNAFSPTSRPPPKMRATLDDQDQLVDLGTEEGVLPSHDLKEKYKMNEDTEAGATSKDAHAIDDLHELMYHVSDEPGSSAGHQHQHSSEQSQHILLTRLHDNLERRLLPFWSSVLANRTVKIAVWLGHRGESKSHGTREHTRSVSDRFKNMESNEAEEAALMNPPLVQATVQTGPDGSFNARVWVSWEDLCVHPKGVHMVFSEDDNQPGGEGGASKRLPEHEVEVWIEMPMTGSEMVVNPGEPSSPGGIHIPATTPYPSNVPPSPLSATATTSSALPPSMATLRTHVEIPITHTPIRVLSDIDDTVKSAGVVSGARAIFHNVFVKDMRDIVIPGMGEWYAGMWSLGVRFHYVSNGPFEILPVVNEFFQMAQLPPGSIKLRSYAGRSLFNGLLSAPAARKRQGVLDVLESFKDSRFILIGDSGEQDLELYAEMARERPHQVLAVFVRDVMADTHHPDEAPRPIDDPTGWGIYGISSENGAGAELGSESATPTDAKKSGVLGQLDDDTPYLTTSPTMDPEDITRDSIANDLDETPKPNKFTPRFVDSPSMEPGTPSTSRPHRKSREENASMSALLDGVAVPRAQFNSRPSTKTRLKEALAGSSRLSTRSGSGVIDKPPSATAPPMIPTLVRSGLGAPTAMPASMSGTSTDYFTPNEKLAKEYDSESEGSFTSSLTSDTESSGTSSAEWGQSQWKSGKRRRMKKKLGLTKSSGSSGGGSGTWRAGSRSSMGSVNGAGASGPMSEVEKKRAELQSRVYRARRIMPSNVPLRLFRDPVECVEAGEILKREGML